MTSQRLYRILLVVSSVSANQREISLRRRFPSFFPYLFQFQKSEQNMYSRCPIAMVNGCQDGALCVHLSCNMRSRTLYKDRINPASTAYNNARPSHLLCRFSTSVFLKMITRSVLCFVYMALEVVLL